MTVLVTGGTGFIGAALVRNLLAERSGRRREPALKRFPRERLVLTSECGFGHVPLDITRRKLAVLVEASRTL